MQVATVPGSASGTRDRPADTLCSRQAFAVSVGDAGTNSTGAQRDTVRRRAYPVWTWLLRTCVSAQCPANREAVHARPLLEGLLVDAPHSINSVGLSPRAGKVP